MSDPLAPSTRTGTSRVDRAHRAFFRLRAFIHTNLWVRARRMDPRHRVFISHRRPPGRPGEAGVTPFAAQLHTVTARAFGAENVFFDLTTLHAGVDLHGTIRMAVERAWAVVVIIEEGWERPRPDDTRGIDDPADWCHQELVRALTAQRYPLLSHVFNDRPAFPVILPVVVARDRPAGLENGPLRDFSSQKLLFLHAQPDDPTWKVEVLATLSGVIEDAHAARWDIVLTAVFTVIGALALTGLLYLTGRLP